MSYGFKVSKDGYDVNTATADQLSASSAYQSETVVLMGTVIHSHVATTSAVTNIAHGLGVPHQFWMSAGGSIFMPKLLGTTGSPAAVYYEAYCNSTNLTIQTTTGSATTMSDRTMYYKILNNTF